MGWQRPEARRRRGCCCRRGGGETGGTGGTGGCGGVGWRWEVGAEPGCCGGDGSWLPWRGPKAAAGEEVGAEAQEEERAEAERRVADPNAGLCSPGSDGPVGPPAPRFGAAGFPEASAGSR